MKIWITEIGEPLPLEKEARLHRYGMLTRALAKRGHDVTWWTSTFTHAKKIHLCEKDSIQTVDGVTLRLLRGPGYRRNISPQRFQHQAHFARRFYEEALKLAPPDVLISPVPTIEVAELAAKYGKQVGIPVLTDIRDEWPDEFVDLAPKPLRPMARIALSPYFRKMRYLCENMTGIIGTSQKKLAYGLSFAKRNEGASDTILPIGYSEESVDASKLALAKKNWLAQGVKPEAFVVCFFGTIGKFFDLDTVFRAARRLKSVGDFQFVLAGDGSRLEKFKDAAKDLPNVLFPGWVDAPSIAALMEMSEVGLAPYRKGARMSLPNKPFEYFAGGLPVVSSLEGELADLLRHHHCGISYPGDDDEALARALTELHASSSLVSTIGKNGRALLESKFSIDVIAKQLETHLASVVERF